MRLVQEAFEDLENKLVKYLRQEGIDLRGDENYYEPEDTANRAMRFVRVRVRPFEVSFNREEMVSRLNGLKSIRNKASAVDSFFRNHF